MDPDPFGRFAFGRHGFSEDHFREAVQVDVGDGRHVAGVGRQLDTALYAVFGVFVAEVDVVVDSPDVAAHRIVENQLGQPVPVEIAARVADRPSSRHPGRPLR